MCTHTQTLDRHVAQIDVYTQAHTAHNHTQTHTQVCMHTVHRTCACTEHVHAQNVRTHNVHLHNVYTNTETTDTQHCVIITQDTHVSNQEHIKYIHTHTISLTPKDF